MEKAQIVALHNEFRELVANGNQMGSNGTLPSASNMIELKWNDDLAAAAQR